MSLQPDLTPVPITQPEREAAKLDPVLQPAQFAANAELVNSIATLRRQVADYRQKLAEVIAERDALGKIIDTTSPIGALDLVTTLTADRTHIGEVLAETMQERDDLRAQLAALHPLADGYAGLLAERIGSIE